jgi:predicted nucleotidyltransferase
MTEPGNWKSEHVKAIRSFLEYLNGRTDAFILKGGTALMECYGLDRFSEDVDLDGTSEDKSIGEHIAGYCESKGYTYRIAKDTDTVKRYMINYGNERTPLKVETSFRKRFVAPEETTKINGTTVYTIDAVCAMKAAAYLNRDKIRDLYDLSFICDRYWDSLSQPLISVVRNAVAHKGFEQFDYIVREQKDELIDVEKLADGFLNMYDKLGLFCDEREQNAMNDIKKKAAQKRESDAMNENATAPAKEKPGITENLAALKKTLAERNEENRDKPGIREKKERDDSR